MSSKSAPFVWDLDWVDEVSEEEKVNSVYGSPIFKNTLATSKGKPRKGFKIEDLPKLDSDESDSSECIILKPMLAAKAYSMGDTRVLINHNLRPKFGGNNRYASKLTSTEILSDLQSKLSKLNRNEERKDENKSRKRNIIIIDDKQ